MRIKRIAAVNLKGHTFAQPLKPLNLIVGNNASGKTAYLKAIKLALYGYDPRRGKTKDVTMECSSGTSLDVVATFDDNTENVLSLNRKENGSVSGDWRASVKVPLVLLDFRDYTVLTAQQRTALVAGLGFVEGSWDDDELRRKIGDMSVSAPAAVTAKIVEEVNALVEETISARDSAQRTIPEWLDTLVSKCKERAKVAGQENKVHSAQLQGYKLGPKPKDVSKELDAANAVLAKARTEFGALTQQGIDAKKKETLAVTLKARAAGIPDLEKSLAAANAALAKAKSLVKSNLPDLSKLTQKRIALNNDKSAQQAAEATARKQIELLKARAAKVEPATKCPCCHEEGTAWKARWKKEHDAEFNVAALAQVVALRKLKELTTALLELEIEFKAAEAEHVRNSEAIAHADEAGSNVDTITNALSLAKQAKADFESCKVPAVSAAKLQATQCAVENAENTVRELAEQQAAVDQWNQVKANRDNSERMAVETGARREAYLTAVETVTNEQRVFVKQSFDRLLKVANRFTEGFLPAELAYNEDRDDVGYMHPEQGCFVTHSELSGFEQAIAYAGLCVALSQSSPVKLVVVDDCIIDAANKAKILGRMEALTGDGTIDQFIMVDVTAEWLTKHQKDVVQVIVAK